MNGGVRGDPAPELVTLSSRHVPEMLRIFNHYVAAGFAAYPEQPLSESSIVRFLEDAANHPRVAAEASGGQLLGFGFLRPYSTYPTFSHTALLTVFLDPSQRRRGLGSAILEALEDGARSRGIAVLLAHISSRNPDSLAFHAARGFVACGRFPGIGRKHGVAFDIVWMVKTL